jgi:WD40 repeat protein
LENSVAILSRIRKPLAAAGGDWSLAGSIWHLGRDYLGGLIVGMIFVGSAWPFACQVVLVSKSEGPPNQTEVTALLFSPDGKTLVSASLDGYIRFFDAQKKKEQRRLRAHKDGVYSVSISSDGRTLASGGGDKKVRLWDMINSKEFLTLEGHEKAVTGVALSPDGTTVASSSYDGTIRLWDSRTGLQIRMLRGDGIYPASVAFSPDGKTLASGGIAAAEAPEITGATHGDRIRLWEVATGKQVCQLPERGHSVAFSGDGHSVAMGGMYLDFIPVPGGVSIDGGTRVCMWDLVHNKARLRIEDYWTAFAISSDSKMLATGWGSYLHVGGLIRSREVKAKGIHLWDLITGQEILQIPVPEDSATVLAFAPDGTALAAGKKSGIVQFVSLAPKRWTPRLPTAADLQECWDDLALPDSVKAYEAIWVLVAGADSAVAFIQTRVAPAPPRDPRFRQLVADLNHNDFERRQAASKELREIGAMVEPELRHALEGQPSLELRRQVETLLESMVPPKPTTEELRLSRSIQVLERINSKAARSLLTRLSQGEPEAVCTQEAKDSLNRLARLTPPN